jgi:sugar phosphate permease
LLVKSTVQHEKVPVLLRRIFLNRQAWALFLCHFGIVGGYIGFIGSWAVPYTMDVYGMTRIEASQVIMISLIGALVGAPLIGWVSSYLGKIKRPYVIFHITVLMCWTAFLLFKGQPPLFLVIILFFIIGFGFGANSLTFAAVRKSFPVTESGSVSGFANTGGFLSAVLLPGVFGSILESVQYTSGSISDGYFYGFFTPMIFSMVGLMGVRLLNEKPGVVRKRS